MIKWGKKETCTSEILREANGNLMQKGHGHSKAIIMIIVGEEIL
jgi:hypothetical protein